MIAVLISAWLDVRSKPLRTFAAIAGMVAAVCAVVLVDAAGLLSREANAEYIARQYGRPATVSIGGGDGVPLSPFDTEQAASTMVQTLAANGVSRVTSIAQNEVLLTNGDNHIASEAYWVSSTFPIVSFVNLVAGYIPGDTASSDVAHAIVTLDFAKRLGFSGADAIGSSVWYSMRRETSDAKWSTQYPLIIDAVSSSIGTRSEPIDIAIVSDLQRPELADPTLTHWLVNVDPGDVGFVIELVRSVRLGSSDQPVFSAYREDLSEDLTPLLDQQRVTASAVTWVALIVGGLGILGVGLTSVRERGKDFGLSRALGASKRRVFAGVITQTLLESLLAAVIAIPVAAIAIDLFARRLVLATLPLPVSTDLPVSSATRGLAAAVTVGLLSGLLPAFRAVRTSVVQALRD